MYNGNGCPQENRIYEYIDGEMDKESEVIFAGHLEICPDCRIVYEQAVKTTSLYKKGYESSLPSLFLWEKIRYRINSFRRNLLIFKISAPVIASIAVFISVYSIPNLQKKQIRYYLGQQIYYLQEKGLSEELEYTDYEEPSGSVYQYLFSDFSDYSQG